jgi:branched-chain amino acid transport system permease protein
MGWASAHKERALGGVGGLSGVRQLDLSALGLQLADPGDFALAALALAVAVYLLLRLVAVSPFGQVLAAIRENEGRTRALGCPVRAYRLAAFALAGLLAGVAGAAAAQRTGFVSPELLVWTTSGEVLIMVIVGGMGSIVGPAAGAAAWVLLQHALSGATPYWGVPMGLFFIAVVLFAGDGFWGLVRARG